MDDGPMLGKWTTSSDVLNSNSSTSMSILTSTSELRDDDDDGHNKNNDHKEYNTIIEDEAGQHQRIALPSATKAPTTNTHQPMGNNDSASPPKKTKKSKNQRRRSVVIEVPSPSSPKRQRMIMGNYSATDIVQMLNCAMVPEERREALDNAIASFDHNIRDLHDREIEVGADVALIKTIVFIVFKAGFCKQHEQRQQQQDKDEETNAIATEIIMALEAIECVYRASSDAVHTSFNKVGSDLLQILVSLIEHVVIKKTTTAVKNNNEQVDDDDESVMEEGDENNNTTSYAHDVILRKATKIVGHLARVGQATHPIASFPGFLTAVLTLINVRPYAAIPREARLTCLWTMANLACNADNMAMMMSIPTMIATLIPILNRRVQSNDTVETIMEIIRAQSIASRMILNLSWLPANKIGMCDDENLIEALANLALHRHTPYSKISTTIQKVLFEARYHSMASLRNISAASLSRSKTLLCNYNNGQLLDVLTDVIVNETNQRVIDLAVTTVHNLAVHDTARAMVGRPALMLALQNVVLLERDDNNNTDTIQQGRDDDDDDTTPSVTRQRVFQTIKVLEAAITSQQAML